MSDDLLARFLVAEEGEEMLGPCVRLSRKPPFMFECAWASGNRRAFSYLLLHAIEFNPSTGLVLVCGSQRIRLRGRCLGGLFDELSDHHVASLNELDPTNTQLEADVPIIETIHLENAGQRPAVQSQQE